MDKGVKRQYLIELDIEEGTTKYYIPSSKGVNEDSIKKFSNFLENSKKEYVITNKLSIDQMKLIWTLCSEYGELLGYDREDMREILQSEFCYKREYEDFSISPRKNNAASMEIATEFIEFIIEHSIFNNYNLIVHEGKGPNKKKKSLREVAPDIRKYVLFHLLNKSCAICGKSTGIQLHHWDHVNTIGGYEHDDGLKTRFMSLCGQHHEEFHYIEEKKFKGKYHIDGIMLTRNIVKHLKDNKIYGNHFKAFKEED